MFTPGKIKLFAGAALATMLTSISGPTIAADRYERQVLNQLRDAERQLSKDGFRASHNYFTDKINRGRTDTYRVTLDGGSEYMIVSFCDTDCDDVDLHLYDMSGRLLDEDVEYDDYPIVTVSPKATTRYEVEISVPGCHARRCTVGIGVYAR